MPQDWTAIKQLDFSGGVNWMDDPADLMETELADARNVRLTTKKTVEQRLGYTQYNSTTIGASVEVKSLFHFLDYSGAWLPICQGGNNLYRGTPAFTGTGTDCWTTATPIHTGSASTVPGFLDAMWGKLIYTNGVNVPQIWEGTYGKCYGFRRTVGNGATYYDYSTEVADEDTATYATIGALDTVANGDWILVQSRVPKLTGFKVVMTTSVNTTASSTVAVHYWDGANWAAVSGLNDTTDVVATKTLSGSGDITFTEATTTIARFVDDKDGTLHDTGTYGYWWRISVDVALSATVQISGLYLYYNIQALPNLWNMKLLKPDGFKKATGNADPDNAATVFTDYTQYVTDNALSTVATLGALATSTGYFYVLSYRKFRGIRVTMSVTNVNTTAASTLTADYWNGAAWTALTIVDGTSANSITLAQTGDITWTWPASEKRRLDVDPDLKHIIRFTSGTIMSANVDIAEVDILEQIDALRPHQSLIFHKNRLFLANRADVKNYLFYSEQFLPDVFTGADAGYIGLPSGKPITALCRFYNELFIATPDEIYILEGYTPQTFGLLKINTGGIGVTSPHSVVAVGKYIYFMHSTGFYRFDGIGVVLISTKIQKLFDPTDTTNMIPDARLDDIPGCFDRVENCVKWAVSRGSAATTNNLLAIFDVNYESWWFDDVVAASLLTSTDANYRDILYHGDYVGKVHHDHNGTSDNGTATSAYLTTRGFTMPQTPGVLFMFKGTRVKMDVQSAGSLTVTYAASGATSFTALGTMDMTNSGYNYTWGELYEPLLGTSMQLKFAQATKDYSFKLSELEAWVVPIRDFGIQL